MNDRNEFDEPRRGYNERSSAGRRREGPSQFAQGVERVKEDIRDAGRRMREWGEEHDLYPSDDAGREYAYASRGFRDNDERTFGGSSGPSPHRGSDRNRSSWRSREHDYDSQSYRNEEPWSSRTRDYGSRSYRSDDPWSSRDQDYGGRSFRDEESRRSPDHDYGTRDYRQTGRESYGSRTYDINEPWSGRNEGNIDHGIPQRQQPYDWAVGGREAGRAASQATPFRASSRRHGIHYGKGPKGYARSDDRILEEVCESLAYDPDVDASDITVTIAQGEVTLEGSIENRRMKHDAEDAVEAVRGVKDIHNRLRVRQGLWGEIKDRIQGKDDDVNHTGEGVKSAHRAPNTGAAASGSNGSHTVGVPSMQTTLTNSQRE